ncbi:MAG: LysE family transporter [Chloroflexi bacterium]|nr:LysE family transporter [Chloroflexota bacterium]
MISQFILPAFSFGLSAAVIPGPLIAYLVNTTLTQGWRAALLVVLAPLITDAPIILVMTFLLGQMPAEILKLIQIGGGGLLLAIAWGARDQYQSGTAMNLAANSASRQAPSRRRVLMTGIAMNFLSPGPYLFWGSVNGPLLVRAIDVSAWHALAFLLVFYATFLCGLCAWVLLFHHVGRVRVASLRLVILATILLLLWFGIGLITDALALAAYHLPLFLAAFLVLVSREVWNRR